MNAFANETICNDHMRRPKHTPFPGLNSQPHRTLSLCLSFSLTHLSSLTSHPLPPPLKHRGIKDDVITPHPALVFPQRGKVLPLPLSLNATRASVVMLVSRILNTRDAEASQHHNFSSHHLQIYLDSQMMMCTQNNSIMTKKTNYISV